MVNRILVDGEPEKRKTDHFGQNVRAVQLYHWSARNNVLLLCGRLRMIKKKICTRKERCYYGKVSKFICENRA